MCGTCVLACSIALTIPTLAAHVNIPSAPHISDQSLANLSHATAIILAFM